MFKRLAAYVTDVSDAAAKLADFRVKDRAIGQRMEQLIALTEERDRPDISRDRLTEIDQELLALWDQRRTETAEIDAAAQHLAHKLER